MAFWYSGVWLLSALINTLATRLAVFRGAPLADALQCAGVSVPRWGTAGDAQARTSLILLGLSIASL